MKRLVVIQGGVRQNGTSNSIAQEFKEMKNFQTSRIHVLSLLAHKETYQSALQECDAILFVMPCYVNTLPYSDLQALALLETLKLKGKRCYAIVHGGMPYPEVHQNGIEVIRLFANAQGWQFCGSLIFGITPMINGASLKSVVWYGKRTRKHLYNLALWIQEDSFVPQGYQNKVDLHFPLWMYRIMVKFLNAQTSKQHKAWNYNPNKITPYASEVWK